ncbi:MAG TPA: BlaI/MecI/CopY family transcriptional regulator [Bryobacteraceae bacterium]|nr:BlaI/MecI/CopY family transcriptional regulator [Bryobacteraceae bacterium]
MRKRSPVLTEQELEIMKIVWRRGEATVREVYEEILDRRKIAYTTVMTMLGVLEGKGHLEKVADEKAYVYRPTRPKEEVIASMVTDFVSRVFDGSARPLMEHLIRSEQLTCEELAEITSAGSDAN